jgi:lactate racemase
MTNYKIPYGKEILDLELPDGLIADLIAPSFTPAAQDPSGVVYNALDNPVDGSGFSTIRGTRTVAIAINDKTRPVPHKYLLPPLLKRLEENGINRKDILLIIASGTHVPMPQNEFEWIVPAEIIENYRIIAHNCDDQANLVDLGTTGRGTPIVINRQFYESDLRIVVGNIEPHHFMGFSGGVKSAVIGLGGRQTINKNHAMLVDPAARAGEYKNNPMRQDVEELGQKIGVHLALNAILNEDKHIVEALFGDPLAVMVHGIQDSRKICQTEVEGIYDLVIASPGGYPKDINLYQAQKALTHAAMIVRDGGVIILAAACPEGAGSQGFEQFMVGVNSVDDVFEKFQREGFRIGPHKAFQIARIAEKVKLFIVSQIPPEKSAKLLFTPYASLPEAILAAIRELPDNPRLAILPRATNTIPISN